MRNETLDAALRELHGAGIRDIEVAKGGKHLRLRFKVNGHQPRMYVVPATPSDHRSLYNVRADIRRMLREDGVLITPPNQDTPPRTPSRLELLERRVADLERKLV